MASDTCDANSRWDECVIRIFKNSIGDLRLLTLREGSVDQRHSNSYGFPNYESSRLIFSPRSYTQRCRAYPRIWIPHARESSSHLHSQCRAWRLLSTIKKAVPTYFFELCRSFACQSILQVQDSRWYVKYMKPDPVFTGAPNPRSPIPQYSRLEMLIELNRLRFVRVSTCLIRREC